MKKQDGSDVVWNSPWTVGRCGPKMRWSRTPPFDGIPQDLDASVAIVIPNICTHLLESDLYIAQLPYLRSFGSHAPLQSQHNSHHLKQRQLSLIYNEALDKHDLEDR